jgi:ATP-dependent RNA helicase DDX31/DBP7
MGAAGEAILLLMPHESSYAALLRSRGVLLEQQDPASLAKWLPTPPDEMLLAGGAGGKATAAAAAAARKAASKGGDGAARQLAGMLHRWVGCSMRAGWGGEARV